MAELVSVCIPTYNGQKYLRESLECVINQTYPDLEILIVDDQSSDRSLTIAKEYQAKDNRVRVTRNSENLGLVGNWNKCISEAKGDWVKLHFQDDLMDNETVEKMVAAAHEFDVKFVLGDRDYFFEGKYKRHFENLKRLSDHYNVTTLISTREAASHFEKLGIDHNFLGEPILGLVHRDLFGSLGVYDDRLQQIVDLEYWLRLALNTNFVFMPERLHRFRVHQESQGAKNGRKRGINPTHLDRILLTEKIQKDSAFAKYREVNGTDFINLQVSSFVKDCIRKYGYKYMKGFISKELLESSPNSLLDSLISSFADFKSRLLY